MRPLPVAVDCGGGSATKRHFTLKHSHLFLSCAIAKCACQMCSTNRRETFDASLYELACSSHCARLIPTSLAQWCEELLPIQSTCNCAPSLKWMLSKSNLLGLSAMFECEPTLPYEVDLPCPASEFKHLRMPASVVEQPFTSAALAASLSM